MKAIALGLLTISLLLLGVAALSSVSVNTPGHIRILKGNRAGLSLTPSTLAFGNVTVGDPANITIVDRDTGNCYENITLTGLSGNSTLPQPLLIGPFTINPGQTVSFLAKYTADMTLTLPPGDYSFNINWAAVCV